MARTVDDARLSSRAAREKLEVRSKPYFRLIDHGVHLGYRKGKRAGRWVARIYCGDGKYQTETLGTADDTSDSDGATVLDFKQAQNAAREALTRYARGEGRVTGPYTVSDALDDYLAWFKRHRKSYEDAESRIRTHIKPVLGDTDCARLTSRQIRKLLEDLADSPRRVRTKGGTKPGEVDDSPDARRRRQSTANRTYTILRAALNFAYREGKIATDDAWRRVKPFKGADKARLRYLSQDEVKRLVNGCEGALRDLVNGALVTGCRYGELRRLEVRDYNPDAGTVSMPDSKSGNPRHVYLTSEGVRLFDQLTAGRPADAYIFTKEDGSQWGRGHHARPFRQALERAKIAEPPTFHGLRHTYASALIQANVPLHVVAANLGHTDTRMVEKHYGHLAPSYIAESIRSLAPELGSVGQGNVRSIGG